jgi:hypothetical protein
VNSSSLFLALVSSLFLGACSGRRDARQPPVECVVHGGVGGSSSMSGGTTREHHELIFAVSTDSAGARLEAGVIVRAPRAWRDQRPHAQPPQWSVNGVPRAIGGATTGPLWIGYERATRTLWLDTLAMPLGENNVVLLDVGADGVPRVIDRTRVDPRLPLPAGTCVTPRTHEENEAFDQALWAVVRRAPMARAFVDR